MKPHDDIETVIAFVRDAFVAQAVRVARRMELAAGALATSGPRRAHVDLLIREAHTLKGTAGSVGLADIGRAAALVEEVARAQSLSRERLSAAVDRLVAETRRAVRTCRPGAAESDDACAEALDAADSSVHS